MGKVLIIGAGPAGISAALYARRAGAEVEVVYKDAGALGRTERIENYYGLAEPLAGPALFQRGIAGAVRLGVQVTCAEVLALSMAETGAGFALATSAGPRAADAVVLAAGAARQSLAVPGIRELEGRGVSYCAICDAFFYRGKTVAVVGAGPYALHEAETLAPHAAAVHVLTNGAAQEADFSRFAVHEARLAAIEGEGRVAAVRFADGMRLAVDGVFLALGAAGSGELARKIGAMLAGTDVRTDAEMATNVPGLFAAGDCTGGLLQVAKAVADGAKAGLSAAKYVRKLGIPFSL